MTFLSKLRSQAKQNHPTNKNIAKLHLKFQSNATIQPNSSKIMQRYHTIKSIERTKNGITNAPTLRFRPRKPDQPPLRQIVPPKIQEK